MRFLRNGTGLWLLQRCREAWGGVAAPTYAELTAAAADGAGLDDARSTRTTPGSSRRGDMPARIEAFCRETGQRPPAGRAAMVRCILDSLACRHRQTLERAEALAGRRVDVVHLVGGGAANALLCQLTADVTGRPVLAGPVEATGVGNLLVQAWAAGELGLAGGAARRSWPGRCRPGGTSRAPVGARAGGVRPVRRPPRPYGWHGVTESDMFCYKVAHDDLARAGGVRRC